MKTVLKLEELGLMGLSIYLFAQLGYAWWWFPALLLLPDIGMIGYLFGTTAGASLYNILHHRGVAVVLYLLGAWLSMPILQLAGVIILAHISMDRLLGYGLKHTDSFQNTHLGRIGNPKRNKQTGV